MAASFDLLLRGGRVIDPATARDGVADIGIAQGRIIEIADNLPTDAAFETIDVFGKLVIPGMIDTHAHIYQYVTGKFGFRLTWWVSVQALRH